MYTNDGNVYHAENSFMAPIFHKEIFKVAYPELSWSDIIICQEYADGIQATLIIDGRKALIIKKVSVREFQVEVPGFIQKHNGSLFVAYKDESFDIIYNREHFLNKAFLKFDIFDVDDLSASFNFEGICNMVHTPEWELSHAR